LDPKDRPQARIELHDELKYTWECISIEPWRRSREMGVSLPPTSLSKSKGYLCYWDQYFSYLKILNLYCLNDGVAGASWATRLYSYSILRMEGHVYSTIWRKDQIKKGTSISKAFCDSKWWCLFFYTLNVHVTYILSLTLLVFVQRLQEVLERPRLLWLKI
jgi:hypothetical protein